MTEPFNGESPPNSTSNTAAFAALRRAHRLFVWPVCALFLTVYLLSVWLAAYQSAWMAAPALGRITVGVLVVLANFAITFAVTVIYVRYANRTLDPLARAATVDLVLPNRQVIREVKAS